MLFALALLVIGPARALRGRRWNDERGPDSYRQALRKLGQVADQQQGPEPQGEPESSTPNDHEGSDDSTERVTILGPVTPSSRAARRRDASSAKARATRRTSRPRPSQAATSPPPSDAADTQSARGAAPDMVIPAPTSPSGSVLQPPDVPTPPPLSEPRTSRRERKKQERAEAAAAKAVAAMAEAAAAARAAARGDAEAPTERGTASAPLTRDPATPPAQPEPSRTPPPMPEPGAARPAPEPRSEPAAARPTPPPTPEPAAARATSDVTTTGDVRPEPAASSGDGGYRERSNRRQPAWAVAVAVTTAVIIAGIIGLIVSNSNHSGRSNHATATSAAHHPSSGPSAANTAPPTTLPPVTPASTTSGAASFSLTQPTSFAVLAGGDCWIRVTSGGQQMFEGLLHSGEGQQWLITAPAVVRLGNAGGVLMRLGGRGLALPQLAPGTPYTLNFQTG